MESELPTALNMEAETKKYLTFKEIIEGSDNPDLREFLRSSADTYAKHDFAIDKIEIAEDLSSARLTFEVTEDMQAHEGILHGGLTSFIVDSVGAAFIWSRVARGQRPLTKKIALEYVAPCEVGKSYTVEILVKEAEDRKEEFAFTVHEKDTDTVAARGDIVYVKKAINPKE